MPFLATCFILFLLWNNLQLNWGEGWELTPFAVTINQLFLHSRLPPSTPAFYQKPTNTHFLQLQVKCFAFVFHFLPCDFAQRNNTPGVSSKLFSAVLLLSLHYCHLLCGSFDQIIIGTAYFDDIIICRYDISIKYSSFFCAYFLK